MVFHLSLSCFWRILSVSSTHDPFQLHTGQVILLLVVGFHHLKRITCEHNKSSIQLARLAYAAFTPTTHV